MEDNKFCQSCSMPLENPDMRGTEKDGSKSKEYCTYCYRNGVFLNPGMTIAEMKELVIEQMRKRQIDTVIIDRAVNSLPGLKRWKAGMLAV